MSGRMLILISCVIAIFSFLVFHPLVAAISTALGLTTLWIAIEDWRRMIIPDVASLSVVVLGVAASALDDWNSRPVEALVKSAAAAAIVAASFLIVRVAYRHVRKREGLGLGDVKLAAGAGAWTGIAGASTVVLLACIAAFVHVAIMRVAFDRPVTPTTSIPFGAFLAPMIWLVWVTGELAAHGRLPIDWPALVQ